MIGSRIDFVEERLQAWLESCHCIGRRHEAIADCGRAEFRFERSLFEGRQVEEGEVAGVKGIDAEADLGNPFHEAAQGRITTTLSSRSCFTSA
ncbi:hypothetical protein [Massilia aerilata]|uniref:Uncharacterized protein n=1 Tax=Massilia aerilata TaxID=453817 RepID=A0ABW0S6P6_9BURK